MKSKKFLVTGILVVLVTLCFTVAALASTGESALQSALSRDTVLQAEQSAFHSATNKDTKSEQKVPASQKVNLQPVLGVESVALSSEEQQMLSLVNKERTSAGVGALTAESTLVKLARLKAQDMVDNRYFSHISPTYGSPFDMMKRFGVSYSYAGENLAMAPSVAIAHQSLMQSPGHKANILNRNYDRVGIGMVVSGGQRYFVQLFTGGQRETTPVSNPGDSGGAQQPQQPQVPSADTASEESLMFQLINQERSKAGLAPLVNDSLLTKVARLKAQDFIDKNYFSHTSPTYGTVQNMLGKFGVNYTSYAENLALSTSAFRAHTSLMNSVGNKTNILSPKFQKVGIGIAVKGTSKYYVQLYTDNGVPSQPSTGETNPPQTPEQPKPPATDTGSTDPSTAGLTADEQKMLNLINSERAKNGLTPLKANLELTKVARLKAKDMIAKNYFSHTSPTYGSPFDMMRQFGINYRTAGENLAGAPSVDTAHTNLMNSPGHRANILNANYKEVGIGILSGSQYGKIFVQMFIG